MGEDVSGWDFDAEDEIVVDDGDPQDDQWERENVAQSEYRWRNSPPLARERRVVMEDDGCPRIGAGVFQDREQLRELTGGT